MVESPIVPIKGSVEEIPIVASTVATDLESTGNFTCIKCGVPVLKEMSRCMGCDSEHQRLIAKLDAQPRQIVEKVPPKLTYRKLVDQGVVVTISTTELLRG